MKKYLFTLSLLAACQAVLAGGIQAERAWARETVAGMSMGGVFLDIKNDGVREDTLTGGQSPVSNKVEVHTHINDNGVMRMRQITDGVALSAGESVELTPGAMHLMLVNLAAPLAEGDMIQITLHFEGADDLSFDAPVVNMDDLPAEGEMEHDH